MVSPIFHYFLDVVNLDFYNRKYVLLHVEIGGFVAKE